MPKNIIYVALPPIINTSAFYDQLIEIEDGLYRTGSILVVDVNDEKFAIFGDLSTELLYKSIRELCKYHGCESVVMLGSDWSQSDYVCVSKWGFKNDDEAYEDEFFLRYSYNMDLNEKELSNNKLGQILWEQTDPYYFDNTALNKLKELLDKHIVCDVIIRRFKGDD